MQKKFTGNIFNDDSVENMHEFNIVRIVLWRRYDVKYGMARGICILMIENYILVVGKF